MIFNGEINGVTLLCNYSIGVIVWQNTESSENKRRWYYLYDPWKVPTYSFDTTSKETSLSFSLILSILFIFIFNSLCHCLGSLQLINEGYQLSNFSITFLFAYHTGGPQEVHKVWADTSSGIAKSHHCIGLLDKALVNTLPITFPWPGGLCHSLTSSTDTMMEKKVNIPPHPIRYKVPLLVPARYPLPWSTGPIWKIWYNRIHYW